jgi:hypothetical protein
MLFVFSIPSEDLSEPSELSLIYALYLTTHGRGLFNNFKLEMRLFELLRCKSLGSGFAAMFCPMQIR